MDVTEIRTTNIRWLTEELTHDGRTKKAAAIALNLSASYLSQLLGGKKMGDDVARKIERARGLVHGAMDQPLWTRDASAVADARGSYHSHLLRIDPETIASALKLIRLSFQNLDLEIDQEENGTPLAFAYQYLLERQERQVTAENIIDFSARLRSRLKEMADETGEEGGSRTAGGSHRRHGEGRQAS